MSRDLRERRRHPDAVRGAFAPGAPVPSVLAPAVGDSWRRCVDQVPARRTAPVEADDVAVRRPTLDDVFLTLTGRELSGDESAQPDREREEAVA